MYKNGCGVEQDYEQAMELFSKAAQQGYAYAQFELGIMYNTGKGVEKNCVNAHKWLNLAAASGLTKALESRDDVAVNMTNQQIIDAQKLANEWEPNISQKNHGHS